MTLDGDRLAYEAHGVRDWLRTALDLADELLSYRAEVIAESESKIGAEMGQQIAWSRMREDGLLPEGVVRQWTAGEDACDVCADLDGETAQLDGLFADDAGEFNGPPRHLNCRCNVVLVNAED